MSEGTMAAGDEVAVPCSPRLSIFSSIFAMSSDEIGLPESSISMPARAKWLMASALVHWCSAA